MTPGDGRKGESVLQKGGRGSWSVVDRSWKVEKVSPATDVEEIKKLSHGKKKKMVMVVIEYREMTTMREGMTTPGQCHPSVKTLRKID